MITTTALRIRLSLLGTASVLVLGGLLSAPRAALADCLPDPVGNGGNVTCTGTDINGLQTSSSGLTVTVAGNATVRGPGRFDGPIVLGTNATLINNGTIDANLAGTAVFAGTGATVTNNGMIATPAGQGVTLQGGSFVNSADGVVDVASSVNSGTSGVRVPGGSIRNEGTVRVTGDNIVEGLVGSDGATVVNAQGASLAVSGAFPRGMVGEVETATRGNSLVNAGTITVTAQFPSAIGMGQVDFNTTEGVESTVTNMATGVIEITADRARGILAQESDVAVNAGAINMVGVGSVGLTLANLGTRGENSGTITTAGDISIGVSMTAFSDGQSFINTGTVQTTGAGAGLAFEGGEIGYDLVGAPALLMLGQNSTTENRGDLLALGANSSAIVVGATTEEDFSSLDPDFDFPAYNGNEILNFGLVQGIAGGIRLTGDPESGTPSLFIDNRSGGQISGSGPASTGISSNGGSLVVVNGGTIRGSAFGIDADGEVNLTNEASGTISGFDAAVRFQGDFDDTFVNAGLVSGRVDMGAGDDLVVVLPTSSLFGGADLGAGNDVLAFDGAAGTVGDAAFLAQNVPFAVNVERTEKRGAGTWRFVGQDIPASVILAPAFVLEGTVVLGVNAPSIDLTNSSAGRVEGIGTVRNFINQGAFTPGGDGVVGTFNVAGNLTLSQTGTAYVDIAEGGNSDFLNVTGSAALGGALSVNGIGYPTGYPDTQTYTILAAGGGVSGTFANVSDNLPDVDVVALYDPNAVRLTYERQGEDPVDPQDGFTRKENGLASVYALGHVALGFSETLATRAGRENASSLTRSGGVAPLAYEDEQKQSRIVAADAIYGADLGTGSAVFAAVPDGTSYGVWLGAFGDDLSVDRSEHGFGYDSSSGGIVGGVDFRADTETYSAMVGVAGGYSQTDVDVASGGSTIDSGHVGVYGAFERGSLSLNGAMSYSFADYDLSRNVMTVTASGSADGDAISGFAEASYDIAPLLGGAGYAFAPAARLRGVHATRDRFEESGAGILNLSVHEDDVSLIYGGIGFKAKTDIVFGETVLTPDIAVFYEHNFADRSQTGFATATPAEIGFETLVSAGGEDSISLSAAVAARFTDTIHGSLRYDGTLGDDLESHRGSASLSFRF